MALDCVLYAWGALILCVCVCEGGGGDANQAVPVPAPVAEKKPDIAVKKADKVELTDAEKQVPT